MPPWSLFEDLMCFSHRYLQFSWVGPPSSEGGHAHERRFFLLRHFISYFVSASSQ